MSQTNINIRMDAELKRQFEAFCADVGMSMTTAFCIFAKKTVKENRIPFEIGGSIPNETTRRAIENTQKGIELSRAFSSVRELMEDLNAEDQV
jgi:DNA-damage-inducible protein J